jgi:hypothetical protein
MPVRRFGNRPRFQIGAVELWLQEREASRS